MISVVQGKLFDLSSEAVTVMTHGLGYEVFCSQNTIADLETFKNKEISLFTHTHVREDALQLFGFLTRAEKQLFLSLLKVNGIGPKTAMTILSGSRTEQIINLIEKGDAKALSALPKIGKKTAEQIILALKGKLVLVEETSKTKGPHREIVSALVNLGFKSIDVEKVVTDLPKDIDFQEGVRQGLATLTNL